MTTFNDIFKSSFLEKVSSFSLLDMGLAMLLSPSCSGSSSSPSTAKPSAA